MKERAAKIKTGDTLFGRFDVIESLSIRSESAIYLCSDSRRINRLVAVKVLRKNRKESDLAVQFYNEYAISRSMRHPHLVPAFRFFREKSLLGFELEYYHAGSIASMLGKARPIPLTIVVQLLHELCLAVQALHEHSILHRDIKPENLYIDKYGSLKLGDFGVSVKRGREILHKRDTLVGTPGYLAPEYIEQGHYDNLSDVFAIGVVAFQLLTNYLPFQGMNPLDLLVNTVTNTPTAIQTLRPDCPQEFAEVIEACLEKNPQKRPQSAKILAECIAKFLHKDSSAKSFLPPNERVAEHWDALLDLESTIH